MKQPLVSMIIPTYNRPGALAELLEALTRQTYTNFEVIIVNDAGPSVANVVELYPELTCTYIELPHNKQHVHARNRGLELARGEFIMLCDDDDLIVPEHMERMVYEIHNYDLVYADAEIVEYATDELGLVRTPISRRLFAYDNDLEGMRKFSTFIPSGCLYRRSIHEQIGLFDEQMFHYWDWDFILRVAHNYRVNRVAAAGVIYAYSISGNNMSSDQENMRPYLDLLSAKHHLGWLPTKNFFLLLEESSIKSRESLSEVMWDGREIRSRLKAIKCN